VLSRSPEYGAAYDLGVSIGRHAGVMVVTSGAAVTLTGTFLTWVRSGSAERTSYEIFGLVDRLGFSPNGVVGIALRAWPLVPLLLALAVAAHWWSIDHPLSRAARVGSTAVAATYPAAIALVVADAPQISLFEVGPGPAVTVAGCAVMLLGLALDHISATLLGRAGRPSRPAGGRS
jgi:hypothetical protein